MDELAAYLALVRDLLRPVDDQGIRDAAEVRVLLVEAEGRVRGVGPAHRIMGEGAGLAHHVIEFFRFFQRHAAAQGRGEDIGRAGGRALRRAAIVGEDQDQGVVELAQRRKLIRQPPDIAVERRDHAGIDLHIAGVEPLLAGAERVPGLRAEGKGRQLGVLGNDARRLLPRQPLGPHGVPALVEAALIMVAVGGAGLQRRVGAGEGELQEERLFRRGGTLGAHKPDRLIGQVVRDVVVGVARRLDGRHAVEQGARLEVVGGVALIPVGALEAPAGRPVVEGPGGAVVGRVVHVPLADEEGRPALALQRLGQRRRLQGQIAAIAGKAAVDVGQPAHPRRVMVEPRQQRRAGAAAHGRGAKVRIAQAVGGEGVDPRRLDLAAIAAKVCKAHVVEDDHHDVRRRLRRFRQRALRRAAVGVGEGDLSRRALGHRRRGQKGRCGFPHRPCGEAKARDARRADAAADQKRPAVKLRRIGLVVAAGHDASHPLILSRTLP